MKIVRRIALSILAFAPIKGIAFAANTKLNDTSLFQDQDANSNPLVRKSRLFENFALRTSYVRAFQKFRKESGVVNESDIYTQFDHLISEMQRDGLIETNEKEIISKIPSAYGG